MNKVLLTAALLCACSITKAQDSLFTYSKILTADSISKNDIYDRALIWASKAFNDSKSAINVKEKESSIIAGKAYIQNGYKYPSKKDSIIGMLQIKDGKLKFSISNPYIKWGGNTGYPETYILTTSINGPAKIMMLSKTRNDAEWQASKAYFTARLERLMLSLEKEIKTYSDRVLRV